MEQKLYQNKRRSEDERKQILTLDNANAILRKSEEENYQKHDTLVHFFMILKYCIMNKVQVMEYLRSKPVMEMFEKYTTHLGSSMTSEKIEQVAFGISQIKRRDVQMVLGKVLVDIITVNSDKIKDDQDLLRIITRIIDVHKIRLTDESIHSLDKFMAYYLENTVAEKNKLSNPQSFLQSFAIIIKQLYENGQSMELKKTLTWSLNYFNQLLDSNSIEKEEFEKILQKTTFFVNEVGATVGVNQELMDMQFDIISKIIKYINSQDITKVERKMLYFTLLMCGKNAVYHEEFITKAVQETFKRYQSGKLSKMDFTDFLDTMKNLNMVDKTLLQNLEIINGGFVKRYDNQLTIKDLTRIYDSFLQEIDHIPPKTFKYFLDQLSKYNIEDLNPIQIRMTKGTLHYLNQINYFSSDANLEIQVKQILDLLNKEYEIIKTNSKQSQQLIPPPKTQLIESKLTASLERQSSRLGKIERQKVINDKYIVDFYLPDYQTTKVVELLGPVHYIKHLNENFSEITITRELNGKCKQKIKYLHAFNLKTALIDYRDVQNLNLNETTNLLIDLI
eukprot:403347580